MKFFCFLFLFLINIGLSAEGTIIVLYGMSCGGKSTLALALQQELPGNFQVIKKTALTDEKRRQIIEKATGERVEGHAELIEKALSLPLPYREEALHVNAYDETIEEIRNRARKGEHLIFDVCLAEPELLNTLENERLIKIFVYSPLSVLSERELERARTFHQSIVFQQRRRSTILDMYTRLLIPVEEGKPHVGSISREEVEIFYKQILNEEVFPQFKVNLEKAICHFKLDKQKQVEVAPRVPPDLLIDSSKMSVQESVALVAKITSRFLQSSPF